MSFAKPTSSVESISAGASKTVEIGAGLEDHDASVGSTSGVDSVDDRPGVEEEEVSDVRHSRRLEQSMCLGQGHYPEAATSLQNKVEILFSA